ncbi:MAG: alpha/beta hydrolase [Methylococcales bacterium]|nr:alpha/beta hydrolase [Methylococcales bacterium]
MQNKPEQNWLLLRGLCRESGHWGDFIPQLQKAFPSARIHTLDLPGTGQFHQYTSPRRIEEIADFVRRQAEQQDLLQKPLTLLALSLGGMVGWEWLSRYPGELNAAILINTSQASLNAFHQRLRWQSYADLARILTQADVYRRELAILRLVSNRRDRDVEIAERWGRIQLRHPVSAENGLRQILAAAKYRPAANKPQAPVLLLNSLGDRLVSPACSQAIGNRWCLELQTHPWAGHDLCLDDGEWVTHCLQNWAGLA